MDWKNIAERAAWTLAQVAAGITVADLADLPAWLAIPIAAVLSVIKSAVKERASAGAE